MERIEVTETCLVEPAGNEMIAAFKCGHSGPKEFIHDLWGEKYQIKAEIVATLEKCGQCLLDEALKSSIRCCKCGFAILPGSWVVRYADIFLFKKEWTTDQGGAIACMRTNCCQNPFAVSGNWDGERFKSVFGGMVIGADVFDGGGLGGFGD